MNELYQYCNRLCIILCLCCATCSSAISQTRTIDSLRIITLVTNTAAEKLKAFVLLGQEKNSLNADSLKKYADETRKLASLLNHDDALLDATLMDVSVFSKKGQNDAALSLAETELSKTYDSPVLRHKRRRFYLAKGFILNVVNKTKDAQQTFLTILKEAEKDADILQQAFALNGIGWSYQNLNDNKTSIDWYKKAMALLNNSQLKSRPSEELLAVLLSNIGPAYYMVSQKENNKKLADTAMFYLDSAITVCRQKDFNGMLATSLGSKALLTFDLKNNIVAAEKMLMEAIDIRKKLGQLYFIIIDMSKLAELYLKSGQFTKAIITCKEAIMLAESSNTKSDIIFLYELLAKTYRAGGFYKEYGDALANQMHIQDSINKVNSATSLNELQTLYEVQKKEVVISKQEYDLLQRKLLLLGISIIAFAVLLIVFIRFRQYKHKQKLKMAAFEVEEKKQREIATKEAGEKERKRIAAELHDNLGVQANAILHNSNLLGTNRTDDTAAITNLQETAREMLLNLRETLWAMKANDIPAQELWLRIINFMKQMGRHYSTIHFETTGTAPADFILSSGKSLDIVLVIQEAVNNAVRHSLSQNITVHSQFEHHCWMIFIKDNGIGFNTAEGFSKIDSYGFGNMQERALNSNFKIEFHSNPGGGTLIKLIVLA